MLLLEKGRRPVRAVHGRVARRAVPVARHAEVVEGGRLRAEHARRERRVALEAEEVALYSRSLNKLQEAIFHGQKDFAVADERILDKIKITWNNGE